MTNQVIVAGVGMIPCTVPGASEPFFDMGERAARIALQYNLGLGGARVVTLYGQPQ